MLRDCPRVFNGAVTENERGKNIIWHIQDYAKSETQQRPQRSGVMADFVMREECDTYRPRVVPHVCQSSHRVVLQSIYLARYLHT